MPTQHPSDVLIEARRFVSVDIETAGPLPARYSILSIGACLVREPTHTFYVELQPTSPEYTPDALAVSGLSMEKLALEGTPPALAMRQFADWLKSELGEEMPVFVAFNAPFDWMFINDYFHRFLGYNPFGHAALDIKAYYMGLKNVPWSHTNFRRISQGRLERNELYHHALQDAIDQGEVFRRLIAEAADQSRPE